MKTRLTALAPLALLGTLSLHPAGAGQLQAGAARVSITPAADEFPYVYDRTKSCEPLFVPGKSCDFVGVHDAIYARALVLGDGARSVAVVVVEAESVPDAASLKSAIAKAAAIPEPNVLLAATHTHEVPLVTYHGGTPDAAQAREIERLKAGAIEAVRSARAKLTNARIAFGRGNGWVNVNNGDDKGTTGYNFQGPSDKELDVLRLESDDGKPIALLINYASHAEIMYRSITKDDGYEVSGDLPGYVSSTLEALPVGAPVVLFTAAAEGDTLPMFKSLQGGYKGLPPADEGAKGWALLDEMGRRLAGSVLDVLGAMPAASGQAIVDGVAGAATCPGQHLHNDPKTGQLVTDQTGPVAIPLNVIRINDIALAGIGADVASPIGAAVKQASPAPHTTVVSMTAGSVGYVLADESYAHLSHGVMGSPVQPHCAEKALSDGVQELVKSLWKKG